MEGNLVTIASQNDKKFLFRLVCIQKQEKTWQLSGLFHGIYFLMLWSKLLHFNFCTSFFKLLFQRVSFVFRNTFFYGFWSAVNEFFRFFRPRPVRSLTNFTTASFTCTS